MQTVDHLLLLVDPFCEARKIAPSRLSILLFNDGKRIKAFREKNSDIASRGLRDAFQWLSDNWPDGAHWPAEVPRPEVSEGRGLSIPPLDHSPTFPWVAPSPHPATQKTGRAA